MELFKVCEKDTKTKTYSKEGLARSEVVDPDLVIKNNTTDWINEIIERLEQLIDDHESEIETLSAGKGKKTNKGKITSFMTFSNNHKFHIAKLMAISRLVVNDTIEATEVDLIREELDFYLESYFGIEVVVMNLIYRRLKEVELISMRTERECLVVESQDASILQTGRIL